MTRRKLIVARAANRFDRLEGCRQCPTSGLDHAARRAKLAERRAVAAAVADLTGPLSVHEERLTVDRWYRDMLDRDRCDEGRFYHTLARI